MMAVARAQFVVLALLWATKGRAHVLRLVEGSCEPFLNQLIFTMQGRTASDSPYYKADEYDYYMYYDTSCSQATDGQAKWIIDDSKPRTDVNSDLDSDQNCVGHAQLESYQRSSPPLIDTWKMQCRATWTDVKLVFEELKPLDPTTTTPAMTTTE